MSKSAAPAPPVALCNGMLQACVPVVPGAHRLQLLLHCVHDAVHLAHNTGLAAALVSAHPPGRKEKHSQQQEAVSVIVSQPVMPGRGRWFCCLVPQRPVAAPDEACC